MLQEVGLQNTLKYWKILRNGSFFRCQLFLNRSLLEYNCFTILCQSLSYNKVNQPHAHIHPHIPSPLSLPLTLPSHLSRPSQSTELISLCLAAASHQHLVVNMCLSLCPSFRALPRCAPCPQVHSLYLHLYSCPATRFISTISFSFFFQMQYICVSIQYLFFSF